MDDSSRDRLRKILDFGRKPKAPPLPNSRSEPEPAKSAPQPETPQQRRDPVAPRSSVLDRLSSQTEPPKPKPPIAPVPSPNPPPPVATQPRRSPTQPLPSRAPFLESPSPKLSPQELPKTPTDQRAFLQSLRTKMAQLAEDFAQGKLNRMQFQEIYAHYQQQRQAVEEAIVSAPGSNQWQHNVAVGMTGLLRERHSAKILAYAIYDNTTSLPLASVGHFLIDTGLLVPMLSSFRSAATEMFGAGLRSTEIEGGRWLCFVPGEFTTLIVLFSVEPARVQLTLVEDLHRDFEVANRFALQGGRSREVAELFTRIWALDKAGLNGIS